MRILDPSITAPAAVMSRIYRARRIAATDLAAAIALMLLALVLALTTPTGLVAAADGYHVMTSATLMVVAAAIAAVWLVVDAVVRVSKESRVLQGSGVLR